MKYYKINTQRYFENDRIASNANGDKIPNAEVYFKEMKDGKILEKAPLFDYFFLESYDKEKYWEWRLFDVFKFIGEASLMPNWLISEDLKLLFKNFNLPQPNYFYPSKLLYKGSKLNYCIFQFAGQTIIDKIRTKYVDWSNSIFLNPIDESHSSINSMQEFIDESRHIMKVSKYDKEISLQKLALNEPLDFFPMGTYLNDDIISEHLKSAIESMGITGFEFSELDYEVVVEG